jgi:hypothetical protein
MPEQSLTNLESLLIGYIREFPEHEQVKIFDLFSCFSIAKRHTGVVKFDFKWLLEVEEDYDPRIDPELDVLSGFSSYGIETS